MMNGKHSILKCASRYFLVFLFPAFYPVSTYCLEMENAAGEYFKTAATGQITGARLHDVNVPFETGISIFGPRWDPFYTLANAADITRTQLKDRTAWSGLIELDNEQLCEYWSMLQQTGQKTFQKVTLTAKTDLDIAGAYFHIRLPVSDFMEGEVIFHSIDEQEPPARLILPRDKMEDSHIIGSRRTRKITVALPNRMLYLEIELDAASRVQLQDNRQWHSQYYVLMFAMNTGSMRTNASSTIGLTYSIQGKRDQSPVKLSLNDNIGKLVFEGVGGNYCFQTNSPQTDRTIQDFKPQWARTEISLRYWIPERNENAPGPGEAKRLAAEYDKDNSNLRREFLLAKRLQEGGAKLIASVWDLPEWMYERQGLPAYTYQRRVPDERWDDLIAAIVSYLKHARENYGIEPRLVSFNEPDIGICVLISPDTYRTVMPRLGKALRESGLQTKILLGDVSNPRTPINYVKKIIAGLEKEQLNYFGALGFHSWNGALPGQYEAWRSLADELNLPLLVPEAGVDPRAWRTQTYHSWHYALNQFELYQQVLLHARPDTLLEWEFTGDYPLLIYDAGAERLETTKRYWLVHHFQNLTPLPAAYLDTESDNQDVLFTAFKGIGEDHKNSIALHIVNLGASRKMTLTGLPDDTQAVRGWLTDRSHSAMVLPHIEVRDGKIQYNLPAQSLVTFQTVAAGQDNNR